MTRMNTWCTMENSDVISELSTDINQFTEEDIKKRLKEYGYNEIKKEENVSVLTFFINQFKNVLIIILLVVIGLSFLVSETVNSAFMLVIVVFSAVLDFTQGYRAGKASDELKKMLPPTITALRDGKKEETFSTRLVPGDTLVIKADDKIHAGGRLIDAQHVMRCNRTSFVEEFSPGGTYSNFLTEKTQIADRKNMIFNRNQCAL